MVNIFENKKFPKNYFKKNKIRPLFKYPEKDFQILNTKYNITIPKNMAKKLKNFLISNTTGYR